MKLSIFRNQRGFSLVLMCVVTGLIFALLCTGLIIQSRSAMDTYKVKQREEIEFQNLMGEISIVLSTKEGCFANLKNRVLSKVTPLTGLSLNYAGVVDTGTLLARPNSQFGGRLTVKDISLSYKKLIQTDQHLGEITVTASGMNTSGVHSFIKKIPIYLQLKPAGDIVACQSSAYSYDGVTVLQDQMCTLNGVVRIYDFIVGLCK